MAMENDRDNGFAGERRRPNVLVVLTDDQGPWALSRTMPELVTPTLDEFMDSATTFNNYYCASPVCSPARASLLTGRMPSAHGVHDWLNGESHPEGREDIFLGGLTTLPEVLNRAGYTCAMSGKWHVGTSRYPAPGFDFWYAHRIGGGPYFHAPIWDERGRKAEEPRYFTYAVTDEACRFLDEFADGTVGSGQEDAPFYLQVNFTAPHLPWLNNHPQDLYDLYEGCDFESVPRLERHPWSRPRTEFEDTYRNPTPYLQGYAAAISGVDRSMKRLVDKLQEHGWQDNTVVVYMSDNGYSCGHHGIWGKGNGTYPLNFWENSVRVPFIIHMPGQQESHDIDSHVSATSFLPTICDIVGVQMPEDPLRAGASVKDLIIAGIDVPAYESVMVFDEYGGGRMVRSGEYKLVERYDGPGELYNLANDPYEEENLFGTRAYAAVQRNLHECLWEWFAHHETAADRAWERDVQGWGQIHPVRRGYDDPHTYNQELKLR